MSNWISFRTLVTLSLGCVLALAAVWPASALQDQSGRSDSSEVSQRPSRSLNARVHLQPYAPVLVKIDSVEAPDPGAPVVAYTMQNLSDKDIRAFAIRYEWRSRSTRGAGTILTHKPMTESRISPGATLSDTIQGFSVEEPIELIELFVDYVDFSDGTGWGDDLSSASITLAGERAGMREVIKYLRGVLAKTNIANLNTVLDSNLDEVRAPDAMPEKWRTGFQTGKLGMRSHLQSRNSLRSTDSDAGIELNDDTLWSIWR